MGGGGGGDLGPVGGLRVEGSCCVDNFFVAEQP